MSLLRTSSISRRALHGGLRMMAGALALLAGFAAQADDYPSRPIRIIVPYSAGGSSDAPLRVLSQQLSKQLGQQIIVDNRPGMGSMLGCEAAARAAPDGYTLLLTSNPQTVGPSLYPHLSFDPIEDFAPISLFSREPSVLVVHPSFPASNLQEFIAYVRAHPGQVDYASSGNGSSQHLSTASLLTRADLKMVHIPYRGSAQSTADLLAGQVKVAMPGLAAMALQVRDGRLRALAMAGVHRSPLLPDVPTLAESGFPGFSAYVWNGLVAPKGTPPAIIERLNHEVIVALKSPDVAAFMNKQAVEAIGSTPAELQAFMRSERDRAAKVVKDANIHID